MLRSAQLFQVHGPTELVTLSRRPVPLVWHFSTRHSLQPLLNEQGDEMNWQGTDLLTLEEQKRVKRALADFREQHPDSVREVAVKPLLHGVAAHHAGCLPTWKAFIEDLFLQGLIKVVFATETLAAGINMPARTTVLASLSKRGDSGHQLLSVNSMLQMAGRAGRRGIDDQGHTVVVFCLSP